MPDADMFAGEHFDDQSNRLLRRAAGYKPNADMEAVLQLERTSPEGYAALSPTTKQAAAFYLDFKRAAQDAGTHPKEAA